MHQMRGPYMGSRFFGPIKNPQGRCWLPTFDQNGWQVRCTYPLLINTRFDSFSPVVIAAGSDPLTEPVPMQFWAPPGRQDLTSGFLEEIAQQYHELGYGYANILARKYATTPRTVRSWVDRAKKIGIITRKTK